MLGSGIKGVLGRGAGFAGGPLRTREYLMQDGPLGRERPDSRIMSISTTGRPLNERKPIGNCCSVKCGNPGNLRASSFAYTGEGNGAYTAETTYRYVGKGAGQYGLPAPPLRQPVNCLCISLPLLAMLLIAFVYYLTSTHAFSGLSLNFKALSLSPFKSSSEARYNCFVGIPRNWDADQRSWCCQHDLQGCDIDTATTPQAPPSTSLAPAPQTSPAPARAPPAPAPAPVAQAPAPAPATTAPDIHSP